MGGEGWQGGTKQEEEAPGTLSARRGVVGARGLMESHRDFGGRCGEMTDTCKLQISTPGIYTVL